MWQLIEDVIPIVLHVTSLDGKHQYLSNYFYLKPHFRRIAFQYWLKRTENIIFHKSEAAYEIPIWNDSLQLFDVLTKPKYTTVKNVMVDILCMPKAYIEWEIKNIFFVLNTIPLMHLK